MKKPQVSAEEYQALSNELLKARKMIEVRLCAGSTTFSNLYEGECVQTVYLPFNINSQTIFDALLAHFGTIKNIVRHLDCSMLFWIIIILSKFNSKNISNKTLVLFFLLFDRHAKFGKLNPTICFRILSSFILIFDTRFVSLHFLNALLFYRC